MNSTKKTTQKTSGTRKKYKPGQLVTINHRVFRITKEYLCMNNCLCCFDGNYEKFCQKRRMKEADLIIFMDYPRWICLWQALRRYYRYKGHTRKSMADGCIEKMDKEFILWILKNGRSREKKEDYKRVGAQYPDKFIQVRNRRQLRATVIRLLQLQNEKGLYAGTGSRKR